MPASPLTATQRGMRELRKQLDREFRQRLRGKLAELRQQLTRVKGQRQQALAKAQAACVQSRGRLKERVTEYRKAERQRINKQVSEWRAAARSKCTENKRRIRKSSLAEEAKARALLEEERRYADLMLRAERKKVRALSSAKVRRGESDDEVRRNISEDLIPVFNEVRSSIGPIAGASRTEVFLQWVQEHPDDVQAIAQAQAAEAADQEIKELQKTERKLLSKLRKGQLKIEDLERVGISCGDIQSLGLSCDDPSDLAEYLTMLQSPMPGAAAGVPF